jgi:hypothetical protein
MSFSFTYKATPRVKNPMTDNNPLARGTGKVVTLQDRVDCKSSKSVNAEKANTLGTVKVTMGKNFRFGRQASNDSAVLLAA